MRKIGNRYQLKDWYHDLEQDLYIHYDAARNIRAIEYCLPYGEKEKVIRVKLGGSIEIANIDSGETGENQSYRHKATPIYVKNGKEDVAFLSSRLRIAIDCLEADNRAQISRFLRHANI